MSGGEGKKGGPPFSLLTLLTLPLYPKAGTLPVPGTLLPPPLLSSGFLGDSHS